MSAPPPDDTDRTTGALRKLILALFPNLPFLGIYEYSVQASDGQTIDATPVDASPAAAMGAELPALTKLAVFLEEAPTLAIGVSVLVAFVNGDPARPVVVSRDPTTPPTNVSIAGGVAPKAVARFGDFVLCGPFTGSITSGSTIAKCG
jgi:hypothetical protein